MTDPDRLALQVAALSRFQREVLAVVCAADYPIRTDGVAAITGHPKSSVQAALVVLWGAGLVFREVRMGFRASRPCYYAARPGVAALSSRLPVRIAGGGARPDVVLGHKVLTATRQLMDSGIVPRSRALGRMVGADHSTAFQWMRWLKAWGLWPLKDAA
jgi:hypothetical protein